MAHVFEKSIKPFEKALKLKKNSSNIKRGERGWCKEKKKEINRIFMDSKHIFVLFEVIISEIRPRPHYAGGIWKRGFTLKTHQMFFVHTRKPIKCFASTLRWRNLKTQQSQAAETLECALEHAHSKVLVEPTWRNQHGNHHFGRHFGFVFEEDSGKQITWLSWHHRFRKAPFSFHTKTQSSFFQILPFPRAFSKSSISILVWTEGLTGEIKLRFQIPLAYGGQGLILLLFSLTHC